MKLLSRRLVRRSELWLLAALASLCGCESNQSRLKQESTQRWNDARVEVKLKLAADQLKAGHLADAAGQIQAAARLDPAHPALPALQARLYLAQGNLPAAERTLRSALPTEQGRGEIEYLLGVIAEQRMRWPEALECYIRAAECDPTEIAYVTAIVQLMLQQGRGEDGLEILKSYEEQFGWTVAYQAALAECYEQMENWSRAASAWRRVTDADANPDIRERLALALYRAGRWGEAVSQLRLLLENPDSRTRNSLRLALADCLLQTGDPVSAHEELGYVLRESPRDAGALRLLACAYARQAQFARAAQAAEQALLAAPDDLNTLEIAAVMAFRAGHAERAAALARRIAEKTKASDHPVIREMLRGPDSSAAR